MSIVVRGLGLDIDSTSSIVAFGFAGVKADENIVEVADSFTIDQCFVLDFGGHKRKPNAGEWRRWKKLAAAMHRGGLTVTVQRKRGVTEYLVERTKETAASLERKRMQSKMRRGLKERQTNLYRETIAKAKKMA